MISTTLCYIEHDGKYLMLHRNKKEKDLNAQKWIGVGGKLEEGETVEECLLREVREETGLTLTQYIHVGMIKFISDTYEDEDMYLFKGTDFAGELIPDCKEGTLKWVDASDVPSLPTWEGDKYFITPLLQGKINLNMTVRYEGDKLIEFKDDTKPVTFEKSSLILCPHGFSTRIGGVSDMEFATLNLGMNRGDIKERVTENWRRFMDATGVSYRPFVCGKQVHKNTVHIATASDARVAYGPGELIEADGYVTCETNLPLVIFTADCVPVLLQDGTSGVIGAVHCGWRSTVADIESSAINAMKSLGASTKNIKIAIGPAINKCCFEVGREVIDAVIELIGEDAATSLYDAAPVNVDTVNACDASAGVDTVNACDAPAGVDTVNACDAPAGVDTVNACDAPAGKYMLDLKGVVACRFTQLGIPNENIEFVGECTLCHPDRYYSHRYLGTNRGSLAAVIMQ